ncbi:MAG: TRAP transporter substrate-binding protein DctP [Bryobacterales bacterium]|nr:TRAP transporter substrate-binding protein DctP [Bryobacteraceae bacterium]MDW8130384.1 TRAP transporter substrate-binding protein DctP [Bryobacterales bacterium]
MIRFALLLCLTVSPAAAQTLLVKMGTVAPEGSPWHQILQQMGQQWQKISAGKVTLRIYPGGVLGDEPDMITKMRIGQLQAVAISGSGLSRLEPAVACLQIPMMIESYEELDYVRDRIAPRLEKLLDEKGYVVLNWGDAGWVHFFTKTPARRLDDIRKMKLFTMAGDAEALELYQSAGFRPVPLATTDMMPALQTGLIEAFDVPPLLAMLNQWFGLARNMIDLKWAPLVGGTIVSKKTWERIPDSLRPALLEAARSAGLRLRGEIRKLGDDAVLEMKKRGLNVITLDAATMAEWRREVEEAYPKLRGRLVPAELFDEVRRLRDEFRAQRAKKAS